jgi:hypothetical protein
MMRAEMINKYAWAADVKLEAWTVAVIEGGTLPEALRIYGGDPDQPVGDLTFAEVDELRPPLADHVDFYLQIFGHGGHIVAIENNGYSGSFPEIARRCTVGGGRFFSVFWNVNGFGLVTQAIDGAITATFEMLYPIEPEEQEWERRPEWAIGPEVDVGLARQTCLAQLEQQTGVEVRESWLREPHPTYPIPGPYGLYRDVPGAEHS